LENEVQQRKEVKTMKYTTPELTALTPAINAIQGLGIKNEHVRVGDGTPMFLNEASGGYQDWE
jgi:hypothetical protein